MREGPRGTAGTTADIARELAHQTRHSVEEAQDVYERELAALQVDAKVTMYVTVLAKRHAREQLMRRR